MPGSETLFCVGYKSQPLMKEVSGYNSSILLLAPDT